MRIKFVRTQTWGVAVIWLRWRPRLAFQFWNVQMQLDFDQPKPPPSLEEFLALLGFKGAHLTHLISDIDKAKKGRDKSVYHKADGEPLS